MLSVFDFLRFCTTGETLNLLSRKRAELRDSTDVVIQKMRSRFPASINTVVLFTKQHCYHKTPERISFASG